MDKERIEYLINQVYYNYLDTKEAEELIDYIMKLENENIMLKRNCNIGKDNLSFYRTENQELKDIIDKAVEITHKILMNNADNRMICVDEEKEYFDWLDKEMLNQEKILKGDKE